MIRIKSKWRMKGREGGCWDERCLNWVSTLISVQCHRGESELKHRCVVWVCVFVSTSLRSQSYEKIHHNPVDLSSMNRWHCICIYLCHFCPFERPFPLKSPTSSHCASLSLSLIASISVLIFSVNYLALLLDHSRWKSAHFCHIFSTFCGGKSAQFCRKYLNMLNGA